MGMRNLRNLASRSDHKPGEVIKVAAPRGETKLKIIDIERA